MIALFFTLACTPKSSPSSEAPETPAPKGECKVLEDGRTVCFPPGHVCEDPHGIGDGKPIVVDCWTSGGRMCHPSSEIWPECAGGWLQSP